MLRIGGYIRVVGFVLAAATGFGALTGFEANAQPHSAPKVSSIAVYAVELAFKGDFIRASRLASRSGDGAAMKLVELLYLRDSPNEAGYQRIMAFLDAAPNWPLAEGLLKRAERSLYVNNEPPDLVLRPFQEAPADDCPGLARLCPRSARRGRQQDGSKIRSERLLQPRHPI